MLSYHPKTGLKQINTPFFPAAKVGTYIGELNWNWGVLTPSWKLRVKCRTGGSTWKKISEAELPKQIRVEALLLGIQL